MISAAVKKKGNKLNSQVSSYNPRLHARVKNFIRPQLSEQLFPLSLSTDMPAQFLDLPYLFT